MKKIIFIVLIAIILLSAVFFTIWRNNKKIAAITNFEECAAAGYPILESYPEQCRTPDGRSFTRDIGNELEKQDLIKVSLPRPNATIKSPVTIQGEARGYWFFEASFPVRIIDSDNKELGRGVAQAKSDWMTENFVPFEVTIQFSAPMTKKGTLILEKDNPSGLQENADQLIIPVNF
jgi:hypothetical protein